MAEELRLDEFGEDQLLRWAFEDDPSADQWAFVERVLDGLIARRPYGELGRVTRDLASGDKAITCVDDPTISVVVIPWPGEADTFSLRYVGDLDAL